MEDPGDEDEQISSRSVLQVIREEHEKLKEDHRQLIDDLSSSVAKQLQELAAQGVLPLKELKETTSVTTSVSQRTETLSVSVPHGLGLVPCQAPQTLSLSTPKATGAHLDVVPFDPNSHIPRKISNPTSTCFSIVAPADDRARKKTLESVDSSAFGTYSWGSACFTPRKSLDSHHKNEQERAQWTKLLKSSFARQTTRMKSAPTLANIPSTEDDTLIVKIVHSHTFSSCCVALVLLNAVFIGVETDLNMRKVLGHRSDDLGWVRHVHRAFDCTFLVELLLRIYVSGWDFFRTDRKWNAFDSSLVIIAIIEEALDGMGIESLRVLRGLRMMKVLRLVRMVKFFSDLRLMVCSIVQSCSSLTWSGVLMISIMYLFANIFMQGITMHLKETSSNDKDTFDLRVVADKWYNTMFTALLTLLQCITGGVDWDDVVRPFDNISWIYRFLFAFYIVFVVIGVLNVLTGIFVERASELSGLDRDLVIQAELRRNEAFCAEMKSIFEEADADGSGTICWDEFREYLKNTEVRAYLSAQQLDAYDARQLFNILDVEDDREIDVDDFIMGCSRLRGMAKSVDMVALLQENRSLNTKMRAFMLETEQGLADIMKRLPSSDRGRQSSVASRRQSSVGDFGSLRQSSRSVAMLT